MNSHQRRIKRRADVRQVKTPTRPQAPLYRVHWKHKVTGGTGKGQPVSWEQANIWANHGNATQRDIKHWVEPAGSGR